ncbi:MAG: hypothetical protein AAF600_14815 [Bacteroidota bacterium]
MKFNLNGATVRWMIWLAVLVTVVIFGIVYEEKLLSRLEKFALWAYPEQKNRNAEIIKLILSIFGGVVIIFGLYVSYLRAKATEKSVEKQGESILNQNIQIELTRKAQINEQFKNAVEHLGSESEPIILGGISELQQIAIENSEQFAELTLNIFCSYIRSEAYVKKEAESINYTTVQTIIDYVFKSGIYDELKIDLKHCNLNPVKIKGITIKNCDLFNSILPWDMNEIKFIDSKLSKVESTLGFYGNIEFVNCDLFDTHFKSTSFKNLKYINNQKHLRIVCHDCEFSRIDVTGDIFKSNFYGCEFKNSKFWSDSISNVNFTGSSFYDVDFNKGQMYMCDFSACGFVDVKSYSWIHRSKFSGAKKEHKYFSQFFAKQLKASINQETKLDGFDFNQASFFNNNVEKLTETEAQEFLVQYEESIEKHRREAKPEVSND